MKNITTLSLMTVVILGFMGCGETNNTSGSTNNLNNGVTNYKHTRTDYDADNNGAIDYSDIFTYNSHCDMTSKHTEAHQDHGFTIPERMRRFTYDSNYHLIITTIDVNNDGIIDDRGVHTYTNGKLTRLMWDSGAEHNSTYNAQGNLATFTIAFPGINNIVEKDTYFYNHLEQAIKIESDTNGDGTIDKIVTNSYDNNGNLTVMDMNKINFPGDTIIDIRITNTYNNDNKILTQSTDIGADSNIESIMTATYDSNGNMKMAEMDEDNDGLVDQVEYYFWEICS